MRFRRKVSMRRFGLPPEVANTWDEVLARMNVTSSGWIVLGNAKSDAQHLVRKACIARDVRGAVSLSSAWDPKLGVADLLLHFESSPNNEALADDIACALRAVGAYELATDGQ